MAYRHAEHRDKAVTALDWSATGERLASGDDAGMVFVVIMSDKVGESCADTRDALSRPTLMPCGCVAWARGRARQVLSMFRKPEFVTKGDSKIVQLACSDDKVSRWPE